MDRFWNAVKGKEEEIVKKKPKVEATMPRIPAVGRGSILLVYNGQRDRRAHDLEVM